MKKLVLIIIINLWSNQILYAQPGTLDPSFGVAGTAMSPFLTQFSYAYGMVLQPDGKIVVTGNLDWAGVFKAFAVRYNADGTFDGSFTNWISNMTTTLENGRAVALQPDSKIVVAGDIYGLSNSDIFVARLNTDGSPDLSFGINGAAVINFGLGSFNQPSAIAVQPDGKILVGGFTNTSNDNDVALFRLQGDGTFDSTFGVNGKVTTDIANDQQEGCDLELLPDGRILVAGFSFTSLTGNDVALFRYLSNGNLDSSFGTNGYSIPGINSDDDAFNALALQPDGKIVAAGYTYTNLTYSDNLLMRFDSSGMPDASFDSDGIVISTIGNYDNHSTGVLVQSDGKIVTTGRAFHQGLDFSLSRFNSNGSIDLTFGNVGHVVTDIANDNDHSLASVIQPDGRIILTGYYTDSGIENSVLCRYLNDSTLTVLAHPGMEETVSMFPQPVSDILHIDFNNQTGPFSIRIYSANSELIRSVQINSSTVVLDVSGLSKGIYLVDIFSQKSLILKRSIIKF